MPIFKKAFKILVFIVYLLCFGNTVYSEDLSVKSNLRVPLIFNSGYSDGQKRSLTASNPGRFTLLMPHYDASGNILTEIASGRLPGHFPYQIQIDLTRFCPHWLKILKEGNGPKDCEICSFPDKSRYQIDIVSLIKLLKHFERYGGKSIFITGGGETGVYKDWHKLLEFLSDSKLSLTLNTNGFFIKVLKREVEKGNPDIVRNVFSADKELSIISISVHEPEAYEAVRALYRLREEYGLNISIRTTFLVHYDTTKEELVAFIEESRRAGSDIAFFKPAHIDEGGNRFFKPNQEAFEAINSLIREQGYSGIKIEAARLDRLSDSFADIRRGVKGLIIKGDDPICIAPLCTFYVNSFFDWAMCCDTKDNGVYSEMFGRGIPSEPEDYFIEAMIGIIKLNPNHCISGCMYMEANFNILLDDKMEPLIDTLKSLRSEYRNKGLADEDIRDRLRRVFGIKHQERFTGSIISKARVLSSQL